MHKEIQGLYLFKNLIKDGAKWRGDVDSIKYSECLYFTDDIKDTVMATLESTDKSIWKLEGNKVFVY